MTRYSTHDASLGVVSSVEKKRRSLQKEKTLIHHVDSVTIGTLTHTDVEGERGKEGVNT